VENDDGDDKGHDQSEEYNIRQSNCLLRQFYVGHQWLLGYGCIIF